MVQPAGCEMKVEKGKVVEITYTLTIAGGEVVESTQEESVQYLHGLGQIVPGLEAALEGRDAGESLSVTLEPSEAFGEFDDDLVLSVDRKVFGPDAELEQGSEVSLSDDQGNEGVGVVLEMDGDKVQVDLNHPLAGEEVCYAVKIVSVRDASPDELEHGLHDGCSCCGHGAEDCGDSCCDDEEKPS